MIFQLVYTPVSQFIKMVSVIFLVTVFCLLGIARYYEETERMWPSTGYLEPSHPELKLICMWQKNTDGTRNCEEQVYIPFILF